MLSQSEFLSTPIPQAIRIMSIANSPSKYDFAYRFRAARLHANLTQQALAIKVGVSQAAIHKLESGHFKSSRKTVDIAMACQVNPVWLATGEGEMIHQDGKPVEESLMPSEMTGSGVIAQLGAMEKELELTIQTLYQMRNRLRRLRNRKRVRTTRTTPEE
ncbi:MAG: helix-turn-helix transcriptional regulator [Magnetococcales bacterium]|nr:helix-turn-helix transcriptional regulator [Magnetococcales bacterium]